MTKNNKGTEYEQPLLPFDGEDIPREPKKTNDKRINYVQEHLHKDMEDKPKRPLSEFSELVKLIGDQFDDNTFNIKQEKVCLSLISQKC